MITIGSRDLRSQLRSILKDRAHTYRVLNHNRPAVAIVPDAQFLFLMEIVQEVQNMGLLEKVLERVRQDSRRRHPWFWTPEWQEGHRAAESDIEAGKVKEFSSVDDLFQDLSQ
jgi:PHD/YefM family antitoxin component YafN of YafNO toxin-antitoxin module